MYSLPYIKIFLLLFVFSIPLINKNNNGFVYLKLKNYQLITVLFSLIIFFGFRGFIDTDVHNYYRFYSDVPTFFNENFISYIEKNPFEIGFYFYSVFLKSLGLGYFGFQFINTLIDFIILYKFFDEYIPTQKCLGFLLYFLFGAFSFEINLVRNIKSLLFFLMSIKYVHTRNFKAYICLNLLGFLFHTASIIFIPMYFILRMKPNRKLFIVLFITGNIIYLLQIHFLSALLDVIIKITPNSGIFRLIKIYNDSKWGQFGISIGYIERTFTTILIFLFYKKLIVDNKNAVFINAFFIYILIYLYCSELYVVIQRVPNLFVFSYWILLPKIYQLLSKNKKILFILFLFLYGLLKVNSFSNKEILKYDNFLSMDYESIEMREKAAKRYKGK